ncbi:hypothetical protein JW898_01865 [Candidatus Woesearchaeota archaeon]|nr:hypothetical protein [Candidatus Woesearchaeota archaeon]
MEGETEVVRSIANSIVDKLHGCREVFFAEYGGAYNGPGNGTVIVRDTLDIMVHEAWHLYVDNAGLSTPSGLPIEEASGLVIDEYATRKDRKVQRHLRSSRAFARLYREISGKRDSEKVRNRILAVAKRHNYNGEYLVSGDKRVSPWAYLTDDLKYMLFYQLCFDITRKDIEHARNVYLDALKAVKETGVLQEGVDVLKAHARKFIRDLYDFRVEPFDEDMKKVFDNRADDSTVLPGFPHAEVHGNDRKASRVMVEVVKNYMNFFERKWTRFINERASNMTYDEIEGCQDSETQIE